MRSWTNLVTMHIFCDAFVSAIAAVACFLLHSCASQLPIITFILGRASVALLKQHKLSSVNSKLLLLYCDCRSSSKMSKRYLLPNGTVNGHHQRHAVHSLLGKWQPIFVADRVAESSDNTNVRQ